MSGHSKWSTIKHKKAAQDQKRGKIFSKLARDISIAVSEGGSGDADQNPRLRLLLQKAREANLPAENVKRAIARGLGGDDKGRLEEVVYEGYGPGGIGIITVVCTDNRQRSSAVIKNLFEKSGGSLGSPGSAMFLFEKSEEGEYKAKIKLPVADEYKNQLENLISELEELEDVSAVYSNV